MSEYRMTRPCPECPFRRADSAVRLYAGRIRQIAGMMLSPGGGEFPCHKTTTVGGANGRNQVHCAGALIFAEKNGNATQMMRIAERLGMYDPSRLEAQDEVFDDLNEMLEAALDRPRKKECKNG